jgi:hypothetical protein
MMVHRNEVLQQSLELAGNAMAAAREAIDEMYKLGYADDHPELVTAYLTMAGSCYAALMHPDVMINNREALMTELALKEFKIQQSLRASLAAQQRCDREPPDLQALVLAHGDYSRITPEAWADYDARLASWRAYMRGGGSPRR